MVDLMNNQRVLSVAQAAEVLQVTRKTIYCWAKTTDRPRLETAMAGGKRVTTLECIQRFLRQEAPPTDAPAPIPTDYAAGMRLMNSF